MVTLPETVSKAWDNRDGAVIFTTVAEDGTPNFSLLPPILSLYNVILHFDGIYGDLETASTCEWDLLPPNRNRKRPTMP